ncbi:centromere/microtubule binding protein cbf5-like protein [Ophiocordyceps camponoti-floridani]|uniref:Centromere/microtubule binding protein cbf5-like protein n=1 Tax=Ophiocordyceps camponoti-floridani TaxID=2030778 RepID=A0A8H4Q513_9HYPO|nr:centromere/microtubule binding protein cbf5-like protein [Ophiocordyceps camponoti-floridani]
MLLLTLASLLQPASAILATPGSPCSTGCGNVLGSTSADDVVCDTGAYADAVGQLFQGCVECEMGSGFGGDGTDVGAMLYNLRFALSYCLFGYPANEQLASSPCITSKACGPFRDATIYGNLSSKRRGYEYCRLWPSSSTGGDVDYRACAECLQVAQKPYLANFVTVLEAGCEQKPEPGIGVGISGSVFSHDWVNVSAPSPTATVNPAWFDQGQLGLGGKVGIAVGSLVAVLIVAGCVVVVNVSPSSPSGEKSKTAAKGRTSRPVTTTWDDTPVSQQPLRPWDDRHASWASPYSSQYNSPVSAHDHSPGAHLSLSALGIVQAGRREGEEAYEMRGCGDAPVLAHPGFGRSADGPPRQYEPGVAEAKRANGEGSGVERW